MKKKRKNEWKNYIKFREARKRKKKKIARLELMNIHSLTFQLCQRRDKRFLAAKLAFGWNYLVKRFFGWNLRWDPSVNLCYFLVATEEFLSSFLPFLFLFFFFFFFFFFVFFFFYRLPIPPLAKTSTPFHIELGNYHRNNRLLHAGHLLYWKRGGWNKIKCDNLCRHLNFFFISCQIENKTNKWDSEPGRCANINSPHLHILMTECDNLSRTLLPRSTIVGSSWFWLLLSTLVKLRVSFSLNSIELVTTVVKNNLLSLLNGTHLHISTGDNLIHRTTQDLNWNDWNVIRFHLNHISQIGNDGWGIHLNLTSEFSAFA